MKDLSKEDRFLDFRTRIRNADSHSDAEEILEALTPANVRRLVTEVTEKWGEEVQEGCWVFENDEFYLLKDRTRVQTVVKRKSSKSFNEWEGVVFDEKHGTVATFKPMRLWNIMNLLEEILETGEISI